MTAEKSTISRRRALSGAATAGLGLPLLGACGDDGGASSAAAPTSSATAPPSSGATRTSEQPTESETTAAPPAGDGIPTSEVPVGGGIVLADEQVVITQPSDGEFKAFSAICTHQGCVVARVSSEIECDCHASRFSITDGSVTGGPALSPLGSVDVSVSGNQVRLG
ncbi:Rieske (2Fe-2S) protein [Nocardioides bizhenqiangii]|uniref:Cytochrome bc1 complex Rieske iron-sulfur subunit n=1 Tax=Nocardioides bizhenqiangii TaxID=3095076 RepID=A0ABZ0ZK02_9ACTN|nr:MULTISPECIES: Rieske (2Fe-2S) protein [unclassified Nocardioides]MDZ5620339.1 Rieske (2Fe-2S) protein [Nocardioides sp. HM23]WQQ24710.1 Rieske (2Fe-2S) protein [Nocardioides sp. HM61]